MGEDFTWLDLRDFLNHLPPTSDSAVYRARYPNSWWWSPDFDLLAAMLNTLQWANWQRGGGRGDKPKVVKRPKEQPKKGPTSVDELDERKKVVQKRRAVTGGD